MEAFNTDSFDVPDSTDWLGTPLAGLMPVEQAFRCHVCKDFFNSPMLTSCNHTFCSLCIRRCLANDSKCPLCRATDQVAKLRGNWALREAVDAFVKSRDAILRFAKTPVAPAPQGSPKRKAIEIDDSEESSPISKKPRRTTRSSKAKAAETTTAMMRDEIHTSSPRSDSPDFVPDDGLVECPICLARMPAAKVDWHIDTTCPSAEPQQATASSSAKTNTWQGAGFATTKPTSQNTHTASKPPERLPSLTYTMLKDSALRKKMVELGLPSTGTRQTLERRHQEWVTLWNANCDAAKPKKKAELLHDLDVWERTMGARATALSKTASIGAQIKDKDFDGAGWVANHAADFKDLIANARKSTMQARQKQEEAKESENPPATPSDPFPRQLGNPQPPVAKEAPPETKPPSLDPQPTPGSSQPPRQSPRAGGTLLGQIPQDHGTENFGTHGTTLPSHVNSGHSGHVSSRGYGYPAYRAPSEANDRNDHDPRHPVEATKPFRREPPSCPDFYDP